MEMRALHAELRGILQGPKSAQGWEALLTLLKPLYWSLDAAVLARFEEEVLPAVRAELERSWPAPLRVVRMDAPRPIRALGGTLHVDLFIHQLKSFMRDRGQKTSGKLSGPAIKVLPGLLLDGLEFEGLRIDQLEAHHVGLMAGLLDAGLGGLKHVRLRWVGGQDAGALSELATLLIERRGQTLESYGALAESRACEGAQDALYRPLLERADRLPALRHLELPPASSGGLDVTGELLAHPAFDGLESVSFPYGLSAAHRALLTSRAGSVNLRRVAAGHLLNGMIAVVRTQEERDVLAAQPEDARRALISAPLLAGVEVWDLRSYSRDDDGWESADAAYCAALRRPPAPVDVLDAAVVDLADATAAQAEAILFEEGRLRPSARLEALRIGALSDEAAARLFEQAEGAWPALECLVLMRALSEAQVRALVACGLLERLVAMDWQGSKYPPRVAAPAGASEMKRRVALAEQAMDPELHPLFGYALLEDALSGPSIYATLSRIARVVGMEEVPASRHGIHYEIRQRFIEARGAGHRLSMAGSTLAWGGRFVWPPVGVDG